MKALVLAAGYATRLYPLTKEYPKPLLKVGQRQIIDYIIEKLEAIKQIDEILVVTNSKFIPHFKIWAKGLKKVKPITLVDDLTTNLAQRRGAIGDMNFAIETKSIKDDLLVIGGDNLFNASLTDFLSFAKSKNTHPVIGIYDLKHKAKTRKYGVVKLDKKFKVVDFQEKPRAPESTLVAMCLYYFPKEKLKLISRYLKEQASSDGGHDATGFYIDWLRRKVSVYGFVFKGRWYDIGDRKFYQEAKESFDA